MSLPPPEHTFIDLRAEALRLALPLPLPNPVIVLTLNQIEEGTHNLTALAGPIVVICERGVRSTLAARLLRADGLDASAYVGGVPALVAAVQPGH